jgi:hypothetical protein
MNVEGAGTDFGGAGHEWGLAAEFEIFWPRFGLQPMGDGRWLTTPHFVP